MTATYSPSQRLVPRRTPDRSPESLFTATGQPTPQAAAVRDTSLEAVFQRYHAEHPEVLARLVGLVELRGKCGCKRLFGWYADLHGHAPNTSFFALYARLLNAHFGAELVSVRARRSERAA